MPLFRFGGKILLFVHIPKTGGTSVEAMLKACGGVEALRYSAMIPELPCTPQHFHAAILTKLIPPALYDFGFTIIRNPFDRLASEYKMRVLKQGKPIGFDAWVERMFARYARDPFVGDNHIRPQSEFLFEGLELFRFEDNAIQGIRDRLEALGLMSAADVPWERRSAARSMSMSSETARRIAMFYAADFERLGYHVDDPGLSLTIAE